MRLGLHKRETRGILQEALSGYWPRSTAAAAMERKLQVIFN